MDGLVLETYRVKLYNFLGIFNFYKLDFLIWEGDNNLDN